MNVVEAHGARIPAIGLGTMTLKDEIGVRIVQEALRVGYRHLDTAANYGNEREVGEGLRTSGVPRDDVFVTTKVWWVNFAAPDLERSVSESLQRLQLSSVDLLLLHWPNPKVPLAETIGALCKVKRAGLTRHIGIANATVALISESVKLATEPLVTNQIEVHPFIDQRKVISACKAHGLAVTAYCPVARGNVFGNEILERIAKAHGKSVAQVALRYLVQQGFIVIPRTSKTERLAENLDVFSLTLSSTEMAEIDGLRKPDGRVVSPPFAPQWDS